MYANITGRDSMKEVTTVVIPGESLKIQGKGSSAKEE
jgi:hypothetical protein